MNEALKKVLKKETLVNMIINGVIGALFAFVFNKNADSVSTDFINTAKDLLISSFFATFFTTVFSTIFSRGYAKQGIVYENARFAKLPRHPLLLGPMLLILVVVAGVLVLGGGFALLGIASMPLWVFVLYKAIHGAILGMVVANVLIRRFLLQI